MDIHEYPNPNICLYCYQPIHIDTLTCSWVHTEGITDYCSCPETGAEPYHDPPEDTTGCIKFTFKLFTFCKPKYKRHVQCEAVSYTDVQHQYICSCQCHKGEL